MAIPHAAPGKPVDLCPEGETFSDARTIALVKNDEFEAIRMVIRKGEEICKNHQVPGSITLHCLKGCIAFTMDGERRPVRAGQWLFLPGGVPHTIEGEEDSLVLLTVMF